MPAKLLYDLQMNGPQCSDTGDRLVAVHWIG